MSSPCRTLAAVLLAVAISGAPATAQNDEPAGARLLEHALQLLEEGNEAGALEELELLATRFPDGELADDALLRMLMIRAGNDELDAARALVERLEAEHTDNPAVAAATVLLADLRLRTDGVEEPTTLRDQLERLLLLWPDAPAGPVDWVAGVHVIAGEISLQLDQPEVARGWLAAILDDDDAPAWRARGLVILARCFLRQDEWRAALRLLQEASETTWDRPPAFPDPRRAAADLIDLIYRHRVRASIQARAWTDADRIGRVGRELDDPVGVAVAPDGRILLVDEGHSMVAMLRPDGTTLSSQTLPARSHPWFDPRGRAYVSTGPGVVDPVARNRPTFEDRSRGREPVEDIVAGARDAGGRWILAHDDGDRVSRFSAAGILIETIYRPRDGKVVDVALDDRGRVFVLVEDADVVLRIGPEGDSTTVIREDWGRPVAVDIDALGNIYVLDRDRRRVQISGPDGQELDTIGPNLPDGGPSLSDPRDLAVTADGRILVIDRDLARLVVLR